MNLRLNYALLNKDGEVVEVVTMDKKVDTEMVGYNHWLRALVDGTPNAIFFYTTDTTDIWVD